MFFPPSNLSASLHFQLFFGLQLGLVAKLKQMLSFGFAFPDIRIATEYVYYIINSRT
jgi:hypothetical protein